MSFFPFHSGYDWGYGHGYGHGHDNTGIVNNLVVSVNDEHRRFYRRRHRSRSPRYWGGCRSDSSSSSSSSSGSSSSGSRSRRSGSGRGSGRG